jgi:hypothetical protein
MPPTFTGAWKADLEKTKLIRGQFARYPEGDVTVVGNGCVTNSGSGTTKHKREEMRKHGLDIGKPLTYCYSW